MADAFCSMSAGCHGRAIDGFGIVRGLGDIGSRTWLLWVP